MILLFLDFEDIGLFFFVYISVLFGIKYLEMDMNDVKDIIIIYVSEIFFDFLVLVNSCCI